MRKLLLLFPLVLVQVLSIAQSVRSENLVLVTLDGMRWQEVFGGMDSALLHRPAYTQDSARLRKQFWAEDAGRRRSLLFPFLWDTVARRGQLIGNRWLGSYLNNANRYWFSYPGYNELLTGYPDSAVNSNEKVMNPNENVLEYLNRQPEFRGKVAAFTTWDVFPYILNQPRSGLYVNAGLDSLRFPQPGLQLINTMQFLAPRPLGVRPDLLTYFAAREYLTTFRPRVLYIAFDETDDYAHAGKYDQYLATAHAEDGMLADLWNLLQSLPQYRDKTTLVITCDHGRGDRDKDQWRSHGARIPDAGQVWMAVIGPDTRPAGEIQGGSTLYQAQIAATLTALLGFQFHAAHPVASPIGSVLP
ncbi:MAG TPA: alkaline phosphatase family protein [Chitinophagaceae bacterium]|nr:alkaline phosphatase family protein [Chitinophagaceae bacterium]